MKRRHYAKISGELEKQELNIFVNKIVLNLGLVSKMGLLKEIICLFKKWKELCLMKVICLRPNTQQLVKHMEL